MGNGAANCLPAAWSQTFPADPTSVTAIKLDFCVYDGNGVRTSNCRVLPRNEMVSFSWPMVAPNGAPADASCATPANGYDFIPADHLLCKIAWNSFGYTAQEAKTGGGGLQLLASEPIKVGMRVAPQTIITPTKFALGNLVWLDIAGIEKDGIQQPIEQEQWGVNGVKVELLDAGWRR